MIKVQKKWRELSKEEKHKIPTKYFNIDEKILNKIRNIRDPKARLIEAAKIQYELFNDIHSYLTTWIAGYSSDVIIRQKFGSTQNLLNLFFTPIKFPNKITPSWADIKRKIKIPKEITEDLAEETGIHIGDGSISILTDKKWKSYQGSISGDLINESIYHRLYIQNLMKKIYNINLSILERVDKNSIESRYKSKAIIEFKHKILKLPLGKKRGIKIPKEILSNNKFAKRCVVGIIDTDFSITSSLSITGKLHSLHLVKQLAEIFNKNDISHTLRMYKDYGRFYIRKEGAIKIIREWKLKNQKHLSKYYLFKEFKKFLPYSTTPERFLVLEGKLDVEKLEKICNKRKRPR